MIANTHIPNTVVEMLTNEGLFSKQDLSKAYEIISKSDKKLSLENVLIQELGYDRHKVYQAFCRVYAFREIKIDGTSVSEGWLKFIRDMYESLPQSSQDAFVNKKILPFGYSEKNNEITIFITPDPTDREIDRVIRQAGFKRFELAYGKLEDVEEILHKALPNENQFLENLKEANQEISLTENEDEEKALDEDELTAAINKSLLVNLFEGCLIEAVHKGASDIHIIPKEGNVTEIHFRVDGRLALWHKQEGVKPEAFLAVVKDRTRNVDRFEWDIAQDGFIQREIDHYLIRFRVSIVPIVSSAFTRKYESVVIRVLDDRKVITDLDKLGFDGFAKEEFLKAIRKPQGMVILTGPTGSGKSTTLVAALHQVISTEVNVLTVEDPVEYNIKGARQLKIGAKMNFDQAIRAILRHDPDIVMVGEIRDSKTAEIAIKLANTGHLTFSTLHTNDAVSVISRLYKMGIEPFLLAYAINLVVAQRLMRTLCNKCKQPIPKVDKDFALSIGFTEQEIQTHTFYKPVGCDSCKKGYAGRVAIHEVLPFTVDIRKHILQSSDDLDEDAIRECALKYGMVSLRAAARKRVLDGRACMEEVVAATME
ncbi:MAG TPA: GspE/PulE family protein [bacterium]|nr:GspE/PulE family protein [bacterium]HPN44773.1 GspE/PulE family protein [bacterium]